MTRLGSTVHILDNDATRRSAVARQVYASGMHAEIYDGLSELSKHPPGSGLILAYDDEHGPDTSEIIATIGQSGSYVPLAMYSGELTPARIVAAMLSGALDYLTWPFDPASLLSSVERIEQATDGVAERKRQELRARLLVETLSSRERQVLEALINGASSKETGNLLGISHRTVEIHRANIARKLNASRTSDAIRIGLFAGVA